MSEHGFERGKKPGKITAEPVRTPRRSTQGRDAAGMAGWLLQLQHTAGNQAVESWLHRQTAQRLHVLPQAKEADPDRQHEEQVEREPDTDQDAAGEFEEVGEESDATLTMDGALAAAPASGDDPADAAGRKQGAGAGGQPPPQRLMSLDEFKKATGQLKTRGGIRGAFGVKKADEDRQNILEGWTGAQALNEDRIKRGVTPGGMVKKAEPVNINKAYEAYQAEPSLQNMIALYDRITYWQTLNSGYKWADDLRFVLDGIKEQIEAEVQSETEKQSGGTAKLPLGSMLGQGGKPAKAGAMEPFLKEVGVPQGYYDEHLAGKPDRIAALEAFYTNLKEGHLYDASRAYKKVSTLEGMYLIKPLFLSHFANQAKLQDIVGTDAKSQAGTEATAEEMQAIAKYSGGDYGPMNEQLRGHTMRQSGAPGIGKQRMTEGKVKQAGTRREHEATTKLAVSALNKLPKFQGIAYRISVSVPDGYFAAVRPGGVLSDLAFTSASPSMSGVGAFAGTEGGKSRSLYYIIHTHTAVNITGFANGPAEGEVLFRPGTRFQVDAVWEHVNGKVPANAPPQAQMVLHTMGEFKTARGLTEAEYKKNQEQVAENQSDAKKKQDILAAKFADQKLNKVKVVELTEV